VSIDAIDPIDADHRQQDHKHQDGGKADSDPGGYFGILDETHALAPAGRPLANGSNGLTTDQSGRNHQPPWRRQQV
jgi:hypothetical protein